MRMRPDAVLGRVAGEMSCRRVRRVFRHLVRFLVLLFDDRLFLGHSHLFALPPALRGNRVFFGAVFLVRLRDRFLDDRAINPKQSKTAMLLSIFVWSHGETYISRALHGQSQYLQNTCVTNHSTSHDDERWLDQVRFMRKTSSGSFRIRLYAITDDPFFLAFDSIVGLFFMGYTNPIKNKPTQNRTVQLVIPENPLLSVVSQRLLLSWL